MKISLKPEAGPRAHIGHGSGYYREFVAADGPFEVTEEEWPILAGTRLFEKVENGKQKAEGSPAPAKPQARAVGKQT